MTQKSTTYSANGKPSRQLSLDTTGLTAPSTVTSPILLPTPNARDWKGSGPNMKPRDQLDSAIELGATKHRTGLLSPAASPASHSALQDEDKVRQTIAISGLTCLKSSKTSDPTGSLLKMCVASLLGTKAWYSSRSALTWKAKVTKSSRLLFLLQASTPRTAGSESGLLLTPRTNDHSEKWDWNGNRTRKQPNIAMQVSMLPTPRVSETEGAPVKNAELRNGSWSRMNAKGVRYGVKVKDVLESTGIATGGKLRLQPAMTEWMMGFPEGWTELPSVPLSGENSASKPTATPSSRK